MDLAELNSADVLNEASRPTFSELPSSELHCMR